MEIIWLGHSCFRLRAREATIVTDPFPKVGRLTADIVTVSHQHPRHNNVAAVGGNPRIVAGPGEYEIKGVFITGLATHHDAEKGRRRGRNTAYLIEAEELVVCHLGDLGHILTPEQVEAMSNVDVLFVPVGGNNTIGPPQASEVISLIEPKIVIPMHYRIGDEPSELEPVEKFLREMGLQKAEPQPKLMVTRSALPDEVQVVVLEPRR